MFRGGVFCIFNIPKAPSFDPFNKLNELLKP